MFVLISVSFPGNCTSKTMIPRIFIRGCLLLSGIIFKELLICSMVIGCGRHGNSQQRSDFLLGRGIQFLDTGVVIPASEFSENELTCLDPLLKWPLPYRPVGLTYYCSAI